MIESENVPQSEFEARRIVMHNLVDWAVSRGYSLWLSGGALAVITDYEGERELTVDLSEAIAETDMGHGKLAYEAGYDMTVEALRLITNRKEGGWCNISEVRRPGALKRPRARLVWE